MTPRPNIVLLGTLDTKGVEYAALAARLRQLGADTTLVDAGVLGQPGVTPDIPRSEVAEAGGSTIEELVTAGDRGRAVEVMARGAVAVVQRLHRAGALDGIAGLGGTGGTTLISAAMRALPVGVPKLLVSTVASGDTRQYVGASDIAMLYSIVDIAGINRVSATVLGNAAGAIAGMAGTEPLPGASDRPLVGATMFGVTTPCVETARQRLDTLGYEVLVFHATGTGGQSMEALVRGGMLAGVLDVTTTELADELVGGVFSAGATRLTAATHMGIPQVVSVGALDMVNFGPRDTVPERFADRRLHVHNASVTLMRTTADECTELGARVAGRIGAAGSKAIVYLPLLGVSAIDVAGQPFADADADAALFEAIRTGLSPSVELRERDMAINDPAFAREMADALHALIVETTNEVQV